MSAFPVWYVISTRMLTPGNLWSVSSILHVYACELSDVGDIWLRDGWAARAEAGEYFITTLYAREPANPFQTWEQEHPAT